jgi:hypothetical protein
MARLIAILIAIAIIGAFVALAVLVYDQFQNHDLGLMAELVIGFVGGSVAFQAAQIYYESHS